MYCDKCGISCITFLYITHVLYSHLFLYSFPVYSFVLYQFLSFLQIFNPFLKVIYQKLVFSFLIFDESITHNRLVPVYQCDPQKHEYHSYQNWGEGGRLEKSIKVNHIIRTYRVIILVLENILSIAMVIPAKGPH